MTGTVRHPVGSAVTVRTLGRKRGEIVEARGSRYRVRVEGLIVTCRESDLEPLVERRKNKRADADAHRAEPASPDPRAHAGYVDLHGHAVDEALTRVVDEIERSLQRGADRVQVIHGKGTGKIRAALHRHLATLPVVKAFKLDAGNEGVTWVFL